MRDKVSALSKDIKSLKKERVNAKGKTFEKLENLRSKYLKVLKE